jgi:DNA-binding SARP family transcriptional activator
MRVSLLGPLEVEHDGNRIEVGGGRLRALLACLALDAGRPVTTGKLVDALWEEELPADHVHALRSFVSRLRRARGDPGLVAPAPGGYRLEVEVDAHEFERLATRGGAERDPERAAGVLRRALELSRGPALADIADYRFAAQAAARLDDLRLTALANRLAADLELGQGDRLVPELEALCMLETIREYGLERLAEAGELERTRTRAARYFTDLVHEAEPRLRRGDQHRWYALLDAERENIFGALRHLGETGDARRAVRLATDLLWFWMLSGSQEEAATWLLFALAVPGDADPDDRVIGESVLALDAIAKSSDPDALKRTMSEVAARARELHDGERPLVAVGKVALELFTGDEERRQAAAARALAHPDRWVHPAVRLLRAGTAENDGRSWRRRWRGSRSCRATWSSPTASCATRASGSSGAGRRCRSPTTARRWSRR